METFRCLCLPGTVTPMDGHTLCEDEEPKVERRRHRTQLKKKSENGVVLAVQQNRWQDEMKSR